MSRDVSPPEFEDRGRDLDSDTRRDGRHSQVREPPDSTPSSPTLERSPEHPPDDRHPEIQFRDGRAVLYDRDRGYRLGESEIRTIIELGKFRVVATHDLAEHTYGGQGEAAERDVQNLARQGLVRKGTFHGSEANPRELLTLTKRGYRLLRANRLAPKNQAVYYGFVKPREANHDADLYRLYQKEAARIEKKGGRNFRVILDYELKRKINREIARFGTAARPEIAARHGLQVVRNKIPVPDLRIEYETRGGDMARVNLELVTEHYRARHVADKVHAGCSLYTPHGEADHLRRVLDQHELTAEILSL
jgi:ribosomal protein S25